MREGRLLCEGDPEVLINLGGVNNLDELFVQLCTDDSAEGKKDSNKKNDSSSSLYAVSGWYEAYWISFTILSLVPRNKLPSL